MNAESYSRAARARPKPLRYQSRGEVDIPTARACRAHTNVHGEKEAIQGQTAPRGTAISGNTLFCPMMGAGPPIATYDALLLSPPVPISIDFGRKRAGVEPSSAFCRCRPTHWTARTERPKNASSAYSHLFPRPGDWSPRRLWYPPHKTRPVRGVRRTSRPLCPRPNDAISCQVPQLSSSVTMSRRITKHSVDPDVTFQYDETPDVTRPPGAKNCDSVFSSCGGAFVSGKTLLLGTIRQDGFRLFASEETIHQRHSDPCCGTRPST